MNDKPDALQAQASAVEALEQLFALTREIALRGVDEAAGSPSMRALQRALSRAAPPFSLQLLSDAVLRDRRPLPLSSEQLRRCQSLCAAFARWGVQQVSFDEVPEPDALLQLAKALFTVTNSGGGSRPPQLPGLRFAALSRPGLHPAPSEALLDVYLSEQIARAVEHAQQLAAGGRAWPIAAAQSLVWRIERCLAAGVSATARAIELAQVPWPLGRRSVAAAFYAGATLSRLQVSPLSQRAAMHAMLALCRYGLCERGGEPLQGAAQLAAPALSAAAAGGALDPHGLRVCTLLQAACARDGRFAPPLLPLLRAVYELERRRQPAEPELWLSRVDLQAWLAGALDHELDPSWGRALLGVLGLLPAGSHVLADGRLGVVMAASEQGGPLRPRILVGGQMLVPEQPAQACSPLGMTPWAK